MPAASSSSDFQSQPPEHSASSELTSEIPLPQSSRPRCSQKGCVFPAAPGGDGRCLYHNREQREPSLFSSYQPSRLLADQALFGPVALDIENARLRDRRRLAALRAASMES